MTTQPHQSSGHDASHEKSEMIKIFSSIRDSLDVLPKIRDEISNLVKLQKSAPPIEGVKSESIANLPVIEEQDSPSENECQQKHPLKQDSTRYSDGDSLSQTQTESEQSESSSPHSPESEWDDAEGNIEAHQSEMDSGFSKSAADKFILNRCWPEWIKSNSLAEWYEILYHALADSSSPPSVGLLFAALHTSNAALCDNDPKTLHDSLRDIGRRLYAWLRDLEKSEIDAANIAERWARVINAHCAGRGEVDVPVPGCEANNQWMIFQPRGGSSPDVLSVRTWCVRDAQKRPVHRAEVTV